MTRHFHTFNVITNGGPSDEHKVLAEPGCAMALAPAYGPKFIHHLREMFPAENGIRNTVFIVSEGLEASPAEMDKSRRALCYDPEAGNIILGVFATRYRLLSKERKPNKLDRSSW